MYRQRKMLDIAGDCNVKIKNRIKKEHVNEIEGKCGLG